jgi:hypothetical protein
MMKWPICILLIASSMTTLYGQEIGRSRQSYFGIGAGLDHGGFGVRLDVLITSSTSLFGGIGYNLATLGWNAGFHHRFNEGMRTRPYFTAMYGYNLAAGNIRFEGVNYYGPTFGGGGEFQLGEKGSFFRLGILVPIRSEEARELAARSEYRLPVLFSFGVHF